MSRSFTGVRALDDVSLELHRHEVVGLIGPNGAGKSTLVNVLSGFDVPTSGQVELGDVDVTGWSPHRRGRAGIARTFQHSRSFRGLTVRENVEVAALGVGAGARAARARADDLLELLGLADSARRPRERSRTATSGGSASPARSRRSRRSCCSTSLPPACRRRRCRSSRRSFARCATTTTRACS